ncbi:MAG: glycosyltransferase family 4 protein [Victivallaceae bacterium]|nr:glycosyltransferase family 4 protein [Victivallaceae bacterium]
MKIFISAYACEPQKGSEPGIGWNIVNELSRYHEVHVLTRSNNIEDIEQALSSVERRPVFLGYDLPKWMSFWKRRRHGYRLYYYLWQYCAFFKYRKFVNSSGFDLVLHLTFANFSMPSLFMLCHPMTVWGPVGRTAIHPAVRRALPFRVKLFESLRSCGMGLLRIFESGRLLTPICADWILESGTLPEESCFPKRWQKKILRHPQTGINTAEPEYRTERHRVEDGRIRLLICSELLHWKGVTFSAEVFGRIASKRLDVELYVYGCGPEEDAMRRIFRRYRVEDRVVWKGFVDKAEMIQALFDADILLYPSYHHGLATVVLQSMYARLPIVTIAGDPVAQCVSEAGGIVVDGSTMTELMDGLTASTLRLLDSPELRREIGFRGKELVVEKYSWTVLCRRLADLLEYMIGR